MPTRPRRSATIRQARGAPQEVVEVKNGRRSRWTGSCIGPVLVEMVWNQETAHVINSIQGVIKFLHHGGGHIPVGVEPMPLRQEEVNRLLGVAEEVAGKRRKIPFMVGQAVKSPGLTDNGTVEVIADKKVRVSVSCLAADVSGSWLLATEGILKIAEANWQFEICF
jgi:transcription antitermination factor NusG